MTGFYGCPNMWFFLETWDLLRSLGRDNTLHWLVCGDFNKIFYSFKKKERAFRDEGCIKDF